MMLITGCARSGTGAIAKYLGAEGLDIGHESRLGDDGIASWFLAKRSAVPPVGHASTPRHWDRIIHLVRHPLDCIASLGKLSEGAWGWVWANGGNAYDGSLECRMRYWVRWNLYASARCDERWRIEDQDDHGIGKKVNTRNPDTLLWSELTQTNQILANRVKGLAEEYGYETR